MAPSNCRPAGETTADQRADHAAGASGRSCAGDPVQRGEPAARDQHERRNRRCGWRHWRACCVSALLMPLTEQQPAGDAEHHREQEGRPAEQEEQHVGEPRADRARCCCATRRDAAGEARTRVLRVCKWPARRAAPAPSTASSSAALSRRPRSTAAVKRDCPEALDAAVANLAITLGSRPRTEFSTGLLFDRQACRLRGRRVPSAGVLTLKHQRGKKYT